MSSRISLGLLAICTFLGNGALAAHLVVNKEVTLPLRFGPQPSLMVRASNGDFIFVGSGGSGNGYAWAARVDPTGQLLWEHTAGRRSNEQDYARVGVRLFGAIDLPNHVTMLCGVRAGLAFFIRVRDDGSVVDQRQRDPARKDGRVTEIRCAPWGDGFAVMGKVSGQPKATGWLFKLDANTNFLWEKFADYYSYGDMVEATAGGLFFVSWDAGVPSVVKIDPTGTLLASYPLPPDSSDWRLVHPPAPRSSVRVAYMLSQTKTDVVDVDDQLRGAKHVWHLHNAGLKAAIEMTDGSIAILGSQWRNSATAAVTMVGPNGSSQDFLMQPANASPWFIDAVASGNPNELATIRQVGPSFQLAWVSIN